jgi:SET family sugar efflux transporter-like MFS transporter
LDVSPLASWENNYEHSPGPGEDDRVTVGSETPLRWRPLIPLATVSVAVGVAGALALPFTSLFLTTEVGVSPFALGAFLLITPLMGLVASTLIGRLSDSRAIRRNLLVIGALAGTVGYGLFAVLRWYWVLLLVSCTLVAVASSVLSQMFAYARQSAERGDSTRAPLIISSLRTLISLAWVGGPPLAALLIQIGGFTGLYVATAVFYVVVAALTLRLPELGEPKSVRREVLPVPRGPLIMFAVVAFVMLQGSIALSVTAIPLLVTSDLHGTAGDAGLILGLCAALEIPLMLGFGVLAVKMDHRRLVMIGAVVALAYQALMFTTTSTWQVAVLQVLHAVVISAVTGVGITYFQSLAPDRPGYATTLFTNTLTLGSMLIGPLLGLAKQLGYHTAYLMSLIMSAVGLVFLIMARTRR